MVYAWDRRAADPITDDQVAKDLPVGALAQRAILARVSNEITHPPHPVVLPAAPGWPIHPAMVTVATELPSFRLVRSLGVVRGVCVRATSIASDAFAIVANTTDTHFQQLAALREQARFQAHLFMLQTAAQLGANAVIGVRYECSSLGANTHELLAYGTAVWAEYIDGAPAFVSHAQQIEPPAPSSELARREE